MIRLAKPWIDDAEKTAVLEVLESVMLVQGERVAAFEGAVAASVGRKHAIAVTNGTAALELALAALEVGAGDEVLCPALTWPSPAHAIALRGAKPALIDVDPAEWNSTAQSFAEGVTSHTKAAIVIDQFGFPARAKEIRDALGSTPIVEDAACALGSHFEDAPCGTLGAISCMSFHPRKVITTGEGGMCLTDDDALANRLRVLRNHGRHLERGFVEPAGNYRLTETAAAMGVAQMEKLPEIVRRRRELAALYHDALGSRLTFQQVARGARSNYQTLGALLPPEVSDRDEFVHAMRQRGVETGALSYAVHTLQSVPSRAVSLPNAELIAERGVALPLYPTMPTEAVHQVIEALQQELS